jgi:hypothetical protein
VDEEKRPKLVKRCAWGNGRVNFRIIWDMSLGPRGKQNE